jgi:hypothetical protein
MNPGAKKLRPINGTSNISFPSGDPIHRVLSTSVCQREHLDFIRVLRTRAASAAEMRPRYQVDFSKLIS